MQPLNPYCTEDETANYLLVVVAPFILPETKHQTSLNPNPTLGPIDKPPNLQQDPRTNVWLKHNNYAPKTPREATRTRLLDPPYSLHCSSFLGLPFRILNTKLVKTKKGTAMETTGNPKPLNPKPQTPNP